MFLFFNLPLEPSAQAFPLWVPGWKITENIKICYLVDYNMLKYLYIRYQYWFYCISTFVGIIYAKNVPPSSF